MLNVSLRTVQLWVEKGLLTAWKTPGGHRRISLDAVKQMQYQHAVEAGRVRDKLKVLIVEDMPNQRMLYAKYFEAWKLPVELRQAEDGFRALIQIGEAKPDLLITDLVMPGMDGFQMIEAIRNTAELESLDIVVVSALDSESIAHQGLPERGIHILHKPVAFDVLKEIVVERLSQQGIVQEAPSPSNS
jgi:excisionase family DNA binding protein